MTPSTLRHPLKLDVIGFQMENWQNELFAYFKPGHQFTNAFTESSNRGIKTKQRDAVAGRRGAVV